MMNSAKRLLGNIRITTAIAALVIVSILLSVAVVSAAIYVSLGSTLRAQASEQQASNLKTAATVLASNLPGADVKWNEDGSLQSISTFAMPRQFLNHDIIDSIARLTGETATIFGWDEANQDFVRMTTNIVGADGERIVGTPLGQSSAAYASVMNGELYLGEALIQGKAYYTAYQPILSAAGVPMGVLYVGVDKARVEGVVTGILVLLTVVGGGALLVLGVAGLFISRGLMAPVPRLAKTMKSIAEGEFDSEVPYVTRQNEIGAMARAVEVFRENGLRVSQMTEAEAARIVADEEKRRLMMTELQAAFGEVVDAAVSGDFTKRVHAQFPDAELNSLAGSVNNLVETFDRSVAEVGEVLGAMANTDLTRRMTGQYEGAFAKLKSDINAVGEKLTEVVMQLRRTSGSLKSATGEILSGANDLSERTTKQAATIEETSAAMEQLASTVLSNAERAKQASASASQVTRTAEEGGQVMDAANDAM
ncbi:MAG: Cache 3/Cache 2 fusion domain-containing protein, partial [Devosia sp.]